MVDINNRNRYFSFENAYTRTSLLVTIENSVIGTLLS